jgi:hypothetical protein
VNEGRAGHPLRDAYLILLRRRSWEWSCTLTFRGRVHPEAAHKRFRDFMKRLSRALHGQRWLKQGRGIHWARALEYHPQDGRIHFHALLAGAPGLQPCAAITLWRRLAGRAIIEPIRNAAAARNYLVKDVLKGGEIDFGGPRRRGKRLPRPDPRARGHAPRGESPST